MTAAPRVSVVMPAYNASQTIGEAMRSVLGQSITQLELIVCDDASTDGTARAAATVADDRVRILEQARNAGPGAARDLAIGVAQGEWVAVIDADDAWAPDRLERLLAAAGGDERMVFDDIRLCHHRTDGLVPWRRLRGARAFGGRGHLACDVPLERFIAAERLLIKPLIPTRVIREHGVRHGPRRFGEDIDYFLRLAAAGLQLRYLPEPLYLYRITPGSASAVAQDPTLMRQCLTEWAGLPGFDAGVRAAFATKLRQLEDHEALHRIAGSFGARDWRGAWATFAARPRCLLRAPRLALRRLGDELHRRATGGTGR